MAQTIKRQWLIHCDAARVPEYVSQNEMNELLEATSSHNRKVHGRSYKPTVEVDRRIWATEFSYFCLYEFVLTLYRF